jgi:preprotein translocase subunit SecD
LNPRGTRIFADITRTNIGQRLAIVLNGEVITAPRIQSAIEQGSGVIQGDFSESEALELVSLLENPLSAPVTILEERSF